MSSVTWTDELRAIYVTCIRNELGGKHLNDEGLNKAAWNRITQAFNVHTDGNFTKAQLHSQLGAMKKKYYIYKELKENSDFTWDDNSKLPVGSPEAWENFISLHKGAKEFQLKPLLYYDDFERMVNFNNASSIASVISSLKKRRLSTTTINTTNSNQTEDESSINDEQDNNSHELESDAIEVQKSNHHLNRRITNDMPVSHKKNRISLAQLSQLSNSHVMLQPQLPSKPTLKQLFDSITEDISHLHPSQRFKIKKYLFENQQLVELIPYLDEEEKGSFFSEIIS